MRSVYAKSLASTMFEGREPPNVVSVGWPLSLAQNHVTLPSLKQSKEGRFAMKREFKRKQIHEMPDIQNSFEMPISTLVNSVDQTSRHSSVESTIIQVGPLDAAIDGYKRSPKTTLREKVRRL